MRGGTWPYAPYDKLTFTVPVAAGGRCQCPHLDQVEGNRPEPVVAGPVAARSAEGYRVAIDAGTGAGEGMAIVEAFRGDVLVWLRIAGGVIERCHIRDASWFQWPLLEAVIEGNIVADFPLCNKSFNCSYSGHDL